jgi:hypothetical protein
VIILHYTYRRSPLYNAVIIIERKLPPLMHISAGNTFVDCAKIAQQHVHIVHVSFKFCFLNTSHVSGWVGITGEVQEYIIFTFLAVRDIIVLLNLMNNVEKR